MQYFGGSWYDCTFDKLKEITKGKGNFTLFDIGAGNSVMEERVKSIGGEWIGFDYMPRKEGILKLNLDQPLPANLVDKKPDVVLLQEVIEHVFNPGLAIENISKMSKAGTHLIITTPNPFWSVNRLKFLFMNIFPMFEKSDMENNHHVYTAWPHVLERILENNGFKVVDKYTIGSKTVFPKFKLGLAYPAKIGAHLLRKALESKNPEAKGMSYGFIAVKQ